MTLTFRRFIEQDFERLKTWFDNPKMGRWLPYPTTEWFDYVLHTPNVYGWMIYESNLPIGYIHMDVEGEIGYPAIAVNPDLHGRGYGRRILRELLNRPEVHTLERLEGDVERGNIASERCVTAAGFRPVSESYDADGLRRFVYLR
jgi:RimJ/RimL family protein N-acetyltransferase